MNPEAGKNANISPDDGRPRAPRSLMGLLIRLPIILRRIMNPEPGVCPITGNTGKDSSSNGPMRRLVGHVRFYAKRVFGDFPLRNKTPERLLIESETERFIGYFFAQEATIREICLTVIDTHLNEGEWNNHTRDERIHLCLIDQMNIIKWMNVCMKHIADEISREQGETFDPEVLKNIRENAPVGIQQISMLFVSLLLSYRKQYKHFPEPEKVKKLHGAIVNIMTQMARGPIFFSLIIRDAIGKSLKNPGSMFYFSDDGSVTISTHQGVFIIKEIDLELDILDINKQTRTGFENRHCAGLALIPQLTIMQARILTDMYTSVYKYSPEAH